MTKSMWDTCEMIIETTADGDQTFAAMSADRCREFVDSMVGDEIKGEVKMVNLVVATGRRPAGLWRMEAKEGTDLPTRSGILVYMGGDDAGKHKLLCIDMTIVKLLLTMQAARLLSQVQAEEEDVTKH